MSLTMESSHVGLLPQNISQQEASKSPSPQPNSDSTSEHSDIGANLSAILNVAKNSAVPMVKSERTPSPEQENKSYEKELEAKQKAFQQFTSSLNDLGFRPPFPVNVLPPFLAALQQNPLTFHQQLLGMTNQQRSGVTPDLDDEEDPENLGSTEPEDLTTGYTKH